MVGDGQEIEALLQLIDDPDQEVYTTVASKIVGYGSGIIPRLESLWETTLDDEIQGRLEMLIHQVHFQILREAFSTWAAADTPDLLTGAILIARYQYPDLHQDTILQRLKKLERNIWLELNNYLTALEKINVLNSILYNHFHIKNADVFISKPKHFFINNVMESKEGNALSIGILYQVLCQRLGIPVFALGLPQQFILGYFDPHSDQDLENKNEDPRPSILFYIDPAQGHIYSSNDVKVYLKRLMIPQKKYYFRPQFTKRIIQITLKELSLFYKDKEDHYKYEELRALIDVIE